MLVDGEYDVNDAFRIYQKNIFKPFELEVGKIKLDMGRFLDIATEQQIALSKETIEDSESNYIGKPDPNFSITNQELIDQIIANLRNYKFEINIHRQLDLKLEGLTKESSFNSTKYFEVDEIEDNIESIEIGISSHRDQEKIHEKIISQIENNKKLINPQDLFLNLGAITNIELFRTVLYYSAFYLQRLKEHNEKRLPMGFEKSWHCDICGGSNLTGCLYNVVECPKWS